MNVVVWFKIAIYDFKHSQRGCSETCQVSWLPEVLVAAELLVSLFFCIAGYGLKVLLKSAQAAFTD